MHRDGSLLDPLLKDGSVPAVGVFTSTFTKKYTGKVLTMVGPAWYGAYLFQPTTGLTPPKASWPPPPAAVGRQFHHHHR